MPIVDVHPVVSRSHKLPSDAAQMLADSIARVLNARSGRVWVRMTELQSEMYAENGATVEDGDLPVFVQVLHADWPEEDARVKEAEALAEAVASSLRRPVERVHVEYAPPGRGRVAFGGKLVR
jgi:phenylpyruvate tautomerase PptA (4-oxalocrotonate tautomerase family)